MAINADTLPLQHSRPVKAVLTQTDDGKPSLKQKILITVVIAPVLLVFLIGALIELENYVDVPFFRDRTMQEAAYTFCVTESEKYAGDGKIVWDVRENECLFIEETE